MKRWFQGTRGWQVGFVVLLAICAAQVGWWVIDQRIQAGRTQELVESLLDDELRAARRMRELGVPGPEAAEAFPGLVFDATTNELRISRDVLADLSAQAHRRDRRYAWEAGFFLVVLFGGMLVLARALREDAILRRRQQNFLASVGHEFKSPLASIRLAVETLAIREPTPEKREKLVSRILDELHRLESLVTNLLDTARIEEGAMQLSPEAVSVAEVAHSLRPTMDEHAEIASTELQIEVPLEAVAWVDREALATVLRNLLDNALRATRRAGGGQVRLSASMKNRKVRIQVADDGDGIDPKELRRLFEKFYRPGDELRRGGRGSGLGLYIVRQLLDRSRGRVEGFSRGRGQGARFTIWLPAAATSQEASADDGASRPGRDLAETADRPVGTGVPAPTPSRDATNARTGTGSSPDAPRRWSGRKSMSASAEERQA